MRYKMKFQAMFCNMFSYGYQAASYLYSEIKCEILYSLLVLGEKLYSFGYSHYNSYINKVEDQRTHTQYLKDGYGRRHRIFRRPSSFYDPINYQPNMPLRRRK